MKVPADHLAKRGAFKPIRVAGQSFLAEATGMSESVGESFLKCCEERYFLRNKALGNYFTGGYEKSAVS
jgi:hypothetical protein